MQMQMHPKFAVAVLALVAAASASDLTAAPTLRHTALRRSRPIGGAPLPALSRRAEEPALLSAASKVDDNNQWQGVLAILGGVMIHLACGSMYIWGNLISYLPASLKYWGGKDGGGLPDAQLVLPLILVSQMAGMPLGPVLERQLGPRVTALVGAAMMFAGVFTSSYVTQLLPFVGLYSVVFGLGVGIAYQMPFLTGGRWFPQKKGMVTGAIISGMGGSAFLLNMLSTRLVNPAAVDAVGGVFPPEVYARWPSMLRTLGTVYVVLGVGGALLQTNPASFTGSYPLLERITGGAKPADSAAKEAPAWPVAAGPSLASHVLSLRFGAPAATQHTPPHTPLQPPTAHPAAHPAAHSRRRGVCTHVAGGRVAQVCSGR
jgi:hypothetical protein